MSNQTLLQPQAQLQSAASYEDIMRARDQLKPIEFCVQVRSEEVTFPIVILYAYERWSRNDCHPFRWMRPGDIHPERVLLVCGLIGEVVNYLTYNCNTKRGTVMPPHVWTELLPLVSQTKFRAA